MRAKVPGCCFLAGGIHNTRTGTASGIEQDFDPLAYGTTSTLTILASVFSAFIYLFSSTRNPPPLELEAEVLFLSRAVSIIALVLVALLAWFRHRSHADSFYLPDTRDGYDSDDDEFEPQMSSFASTVVAVICVCILGCADGYYCLVIIAD